MLLSLGYVWVPITLAISILHFQLWDVDFRINQTLISGRLNAKEIVFHIGNVILFPGIFCTITGESSDIAVVITILILATLFQFLRRRIQSFADRLIFREKVDFLKLSPIFRSTFVP